MDSSSHFSMSWDSFATCVLQMISLSDELHDEWTCHGRFDMENTLYITKKFYKSFDEQKNASLPVEFEEEASNFDDESVPSKLKDNSLITFEYHVVFNSSYSCPVLCFNAWKTNGTLLSLEDCWQRLGFSDFDYKYNALTQMDHPVLMRPFFTLHPCKTSELIQMSFEKSRNPLVSWLSAVGPIVALNILPEYAKLTFS